MSPSNPRPTDAEIEALVERHGLRERARQPEVQAAVLKAIARNRRLSEIAVELRSQYAANTKPPRQQRGQVATLRSLVQSMALGLTIEEMPAEEAALLTEILGDR